MNSISVWRYELKFFFFFFLKKRFPKLFLLKFLQLRYDGPYEIDNEEVAEAKFVTLEELQSMIKKKAEDFTPWFKRELKEFKWMDS